MRAEQIQIGEQRVRVLTAGAGDVVVVLHGWGGRIESMTPVVSCLSQAFRVVALDLPGFGESPPPPAVWGTPDYAAFVGRALAGIGVGRAHFVGHSYGAKTSLYLAATRPEIVDKVVAVGSSGLRTPPSFRARLKREVSRAARLAGTLGPAGRALKRVVYERIASSDYRDAGELRPILVKVVNEDLSDLLPRIKAPTLLVWGTEDEAVPIAHARRMEALIPDAGVVLFHGAGHFAYLEQPDRFCRVVRHFLGRPLP